MINKNLLRILITSLAISMGNISYSAPQQTITETSITQNQNEYSSLERKIRESYKDLTNKDTDIKLYMNIYNRINMNELEREEKAYLKKKFTNKEIKEIKTKFPWIDINDKRDRIFIYRYKVGEEFVESLIKAFHLPLHVDIGCDSNIKK